MEIATALPFASEPWYDSDQLLFVSKLARTEDYVCAEEDPLWAFGAIMMVVLVAVDDSMLGVKWKAT